MSKVLFFTVIGLLVVTEIFSHSVDKERRCGEHGDPCSQGCCDGFRCNVAAERCQAIITEDMLKEARDNLKPVEVPISAHSSHNNENCGKHGDSCWQGCCDGFKCNKYAEKCMALITEEALNEARDNLKPVETPVSVYSSHHNDNCGKHGDSCEQGCCEGFSCNKYAKRCMASFSGDALNEAHSNLKHVQKRSAHGCGKHGDSCSQGCCDGFKCNKYAEKCMAIITEDALNEARHNLKPVETPISAHESHHNDKCGKHGDSCDHGCCEGFSCNKYAKRCMASLSGDALNEAHSNLKHVEKRSVKSSSCGKHGDSCSKGCCDGFRCNSAAGRCMVTITEDMLKEGRAKLRPVQDRPIGSVTSPPSNNNGNCGRHGDNCARGCCNGFVCNSAAGRCMATITEDMLKEGRAKLKPVNSRAIGA